MELHGPDPVARACSPNSRLPPIPASLIVEQVGYWLACKAWESLEWLGGAGVRPAITAAAALCSVQRTHQLLAVPAAGCSSAWGQQKPATMGRMHSNGKGKSRSALPYKRTSPSWLKITTAEVRRGGAGGGGTR